MAKPTRENKQDLVEEFKLLEQKISNWDNYSLTVKNWAITVWSAVIVFIITQYYTQLADGIDLTHLFWIPLFLPIPFWVFDGLFKAFQRASIFRSLSIQDYLNETTLPELDEEEKKKIEELNEKIKKKITKVEKKLKELSEEKKKSTENQDQIEKVEKNLIRKNESLIKDKNELENPKNNYETNFPIYDTVCRLSKKSPYFRVKYLKFNAKYIACFLVRIVSTVYCVLYCLTFLTLAILFNLCFIIGTFVFIGISTLLWYFSFRTWI